MQENAYRIQLEAFSTVSRCLWPFNRQSHSTNIPEPTPEGSFQIIRWDMANLLNRKQSKTIHTGNLSKKERTRDPNDGHQPLGTRYAKYHGQTSQNSSNQNERTTRVDNNKKGAINERQKMLVQDCWTGQSVMYTTFAKGKEKKSKDRRRIEAEQTREIRQMSQKPMYDSLDKII